MPNFVIPAADELSIPRPPISTLLAFNKNGYCFGMVTCLRDGQCRVLPDWMTKSATHAEIWTGWVFAVKKIEGLTFKWIFG